MAGDTQLEGSNVQSDELATWRDRTRVEVVRWLRTLFVTFTAPSRLVEMRSNGTLNSPVRQLLGTLVVVGVLKAVTGFNQETWDNSFEAPPGFGGVSAAISKVPGLDELAAALAYALAAIPAWLFWRFLDKRASFRAVYRAQFYSGAALLFVLYPISLLNGTLVTLKIGVPFTNVLDWAATIVAFVSIGWTIRQVGLETGAPRWRYAVGLLLGGIVFAALQIASPLKWPPTREFSIPSASMEPTLFTGDRVTANLWVLHWRRPRRGELVVHRAKGQPAFVSRVVGLPGDVVEMRRGRVWLNGKPLEIQNLGQGRSDTGYGFITVDRLVESTPGGRRYMIQDMTIDGDADDFAPLKVQPAHYFMLGDNRDNALDSRVSKSQGGYGTVARSELIGVLYRRTMPLGRPLDRVVSPDEEYPQEQ